MIDVADGASYLHPFESCHRNDIAGRGLGDLDALESLVRVELGDTRGLDARESFDGQQRHCVAEMDNPALDAADGESAEVRRVIQRRHEHLKWPRRVTGRWRDVFDDRVE